MVGWWGGGVVGCGAGGVLFCRKNIYYGRRCNTQTCQWRSDGKVRKEKREEITEGEEIAWKIQVFVLYFQESGES